MRLSAVDEAQNLYKKFRSGVGSAVSKVGSFVKQNPVPAAYLNQKFQQKVAQPVARTVAQQVGPKLATYQAPFEQQAARLPQPIQSAFPITQVPMNVGEQVRSVGRIASGKPTALDLAQVGFSAAGIVKPRVPIGYGAKELSFIKKAYSPEVRSQIGKFAQMVEQNPTGANRANLGALGDEIQTIAEATFGKKAANLTNRQLKNLFDTAMEQAFRKGVPKEFPIGLQAKPIRSVQEAEKQAILARSKAIQGIKTADQSQALPLDRKLPQQAVEATRKQLEKVSKISEPPQGGGGLPNGPEVPPSGGSITQDPVQKIIAALKEAKPLRGKQEALYSKERAQRVARVAAMGKVPGEKGYFAQLGQLKGELPKVEFESVRNQIGQQDIDSLFDLVEKSNISVFEKVTAKTGLAKLLGGEGGRVPTRGEIELLGEIFPPEFVQSVLDKRPMLQKLLQVGQEALSIPKSMMATADLSAAFRQGIAMVGRPKQWAPAFRDMFKYAFSDKAYQDLVGDIRSRPTYQMMRDHKVALADMGGVLNKREEQFMSSLPEKIPVLGGLVKGSNRAYTGFLNKLRADTFDDIVKNAKQTGTELTPKLLDDAANFVNAASGRGDLGALNKAATVLNSTFFSPRLIASRLQLLNPVYYAQLDPHVRKEALKTVLSSAGIIGGIATAAKLGGLDVGMDPRSADFLKVKHGNTRWDLGGGFAQYIRLIAQVLTGEKISSTSGRKMTVGEGYKPMTRLGIVGDFAKSKLDPVASLVVGGLEGKNGMGDEFNLSEEVKNRFIPLVIQDIKNLTEEYGAKGIAYAIPGIFGIGSQTYGPLSSVKDLGNPTINEQKKIKDSALDYYSRGNKEKASELKAKYKLQISNQDVKKHVEKQKKQALEAYVSGDPKEAAAIKKDYGFTVSQKDINEAAKKYAIKLYKDGKVEEAMKVKSQYKFKISKKDLD